MKAYIFVSIHSYFIVDIIFLVRYCFYFASIQVKEFKVWNPKLKGYYNLGPTYISKVHNFDFQVLLSSYPNHMLEIKYLLCNLFSQGIIFQFELCACSYNTVFQYLSGIHPQIKNLKSGMHITYQYFSSICFFHIRVPGSFSRASWQGFSVRNFGWESSCSTLKHKFVFKVN